MADERYLIVNADDFGQSPGINRGIIEAHERGIVTSASLMTRWLAAGEAALYAKDHPELSVGLHIDLGEWVCRAGNWEPVYTVVCMDDKAAVEREVLQQLDSFRSLMGRDPIHINSHQGFHMREPLRAVAVELCERLGVPLRNLCPGINYFERFYGQTYDGQPLPSNLDLDWLIDNLSMLPAGLTVLVCHPGDAHDLKTVYQKERTQELQVLCDPRLATALSDLGITLCGFDQWRQLTNGSNGSVSGATNGNLGTLNGPNRGSNDRP
jgi:chitin disaccharide deacetylase